MKMKVNDNYGGFVLSRNVKNGLPMRILTEKNLDCYN